MLPSLPDTYAPACFAVALIGSGVLHWTPLPFPLYILSGILLGPYGLMIADPSALESAGHYGLVLMLFTAGLKVDVKRFASMGHIALWMLALEVISALVLCTVLRAIFGFDAHTMLLWTCVCVLSSTVCALQIMEYEGTKYNPYTMSVLIVQDMALPIMLLALQSNHNFAGLEVLKQVAITTLSGALPLVLVLGAGYFFERNRKWALCDCWQYILLVLTWCIGFATFFEYCGLSCEYGAFLGGLAFGLFWDTTQATQIIRTFVETLSATFFVFIGAKSNIPFMIEHTFAIFAIALAMFSFKSIINTFGLNIAVRDNHNLRSGILLATLSELSFSLIAGSPADNIYVQLIEPTVVLCILLSTLWYNLTIGRRRIW